MSRLTRADIITRGLAQGGQPNIKTEAEYFLNAVLANVYRSYPWPFLLRTDTVTSDSSRYEELEVGGLSAEYWAAKWLMVSTNQIGKLAPAESAPRGPFSHTDLAAQVETDRMRSTVPTGVPEMFAGDPAKDHVLVYPIPAVALTAKLRYYHLPADLTVGSGGDALYPDYPDDYALIQAIKAFASNWRERSTSMVDEQVTQMLIAKAKTFIGDEGRASQKRVRWGPQWRKRRR